MSPAAEGVLQVALPLPLPYAFSYRPPPGLVVAPDWLGRRVRVPFGKGERVGWIVGCEVDVPSGEDLRPARALLDDAPLLAGELLASLRWAADYYHAPLGELLATAVPAALRTGEPLPETGRHGWRLTEAGRLVRTALRAGAPRRLADRLAAGAIDEALLDDGAPWRPAARTLRERGLAERVALAADAAPAGRAAPYALNAAQADAAAAVRSALGGFAPFLLEGVTGSGKTEVYLAALEACVAAGRQALMLVPEIGLTPQALARLQSRLGVPVLAQHSGLADGERACAWAAMARGEASVLVGTRSAVFTPLPRAGLIVVDEEHDGSYKQQDGVRYHARDLAVVRARALGVPLVLGSATPSLESLHNALAGRYRHLRLPARAGTAKPPTVRVVDVRKRPLVDGLSPEMRHALGACLAAGGQALVFRNRRGYAPVLLCHDCGWSAQCRQCDSAMAVHANGRRLQCHHCGARQPAPKACPQCESMALVPQGVGTERLEEALAQAFPDAPLVRVDRASTRGRDGLAKKLDALGDAPGLLVGTQILAKGHDLPNLTLVGVVGVDESLFSADFRAGEKLAQLLVQVGGRAGRAQRPGEVLWQTHHPAHPLLLGLLGGGYPAVAALELAQREAAGFPPFTHLALLRAEAPAEGAALAFLAAAREAFVATEGIELSAPMPAPMERRGGRSRAQLLLTAASRPARHAALAAWLPAVRALRAPKSLRWSLDVDPADLY
jgi:primosomal protein N' (replication factor Y)